MDIKKFNSNYLVFLLFILLFYSLFQLFRISPVNTDLYVSNPIYARFGNIWYGPMFIVPFFIFWGINKNSIYWFEKISLNVIQVGVILFLLSLLFNFNVPYVFFISSFTLLAGFSFSNNKRRIWIILGICISIIVFFSEEYRSGVLRILLALFCVLIVYQKIRILKIFFILFLFLFPLFIFYDVLNNSPNIFQLIAEIENKNNQNLFVDTRTFLFTETYNELKKNNDLILGLGSMGSYFSDYFLNLISYDNYASADFYVRSKVEVGFLQMLLKGGLFYIILLA
jgi:O-Antigen ligase.